MTVSHQPVSTAILVLGSVEIDVAARRLTRDGQLVRLSRTEWRLLEELALHAGQIMTHRTLLQRVWGDSYSEESNYLHVYIRRLRQKIEADPATPSYLVSEPGIGYRLLRPLAPLPSPPQPESAPAAPAAIAPGPIPAALTSFVGRRRELAEVTGLLRNPAVRLLTLVGPGGIGKTRLALAAAQNLAGDFAAGVVLAALDTIQQPEHVAGALIQALGIHESGALVPKEQLKASLRDRALLLVLDNFEQVLAAAPLVTELLTAAPRLKILVTSRALLRVYGEHEYRVPPLSLAAELAGDLGALEQAEAIQLFRDRAQLVRPGFLLSHDNAATVQAICAQLEGLPLAIELAAARLRRLTSAAVLQQLHHRLALGGGPHNVPHRQQTLRNTIDWSYVLLTATEQQVFRHMAVAVGGCTPGAAIAICAADGADRLVVEAQLESLADKSLLVPGEGQDGALRYTMLETIREYALDQLAADPASAAVHDRHLSTFLALAEEAAPALESGQQIRWLDILAADHDNMLAALAWGLRADAPPAARDQALRLAAALGRFWELHGHWTEGRAWLARALAATPTDHQAVRASALLTAGIFALRQRDLEVADSLFDQAQQSWDTLGDLGGSARTLTYRCIRACICGEYAQGRSHIDASVAKARLAGDRWALSHALNMQGPLFEIAGQLDLAAQVYAESLELWQISGNSWGIAQSQRLMGSLEIERGHIEQARTLLADSLRITRQLGDHYGIAQILVALGEIARMEQAWALAAGAYEEALALYRSLGSTGGVIQAALNLGFIALGQSNLPHAAAMFREVLRSHPELDHAIILSLAVAGMAGVAERSGRGERAAHLLALAERFLAEASEPISEPISVVDQRDITLIRERVLASAGHPLPFPPPMISLTEVIGEVLAESD